MVDNASTFAGNDGMDLMVDAMLYGDLDMDVALSEAIPGLKDRPTQVINISKLN